MTARTSRGREAITVVNAIKHCDKQPPGCANPPNVDNDTAYVDSAASVTILGRNTKCKEAKVQEPNIALNTPASVPIHTTKTLELLLNKLPPQSQTGIQSG